MATQKDQDLKIMEYRLKSLEDKYDNAHRFFKHTLSVITIIFLFVGTVITVMSFVSKSEVSDAIKDMERKFELLSNDALKVAKLSILYDGKVVNDSQIVIKREKRDLFSISNVLIKNEGERIANNISLKLCCSRRIENVSTQITENTYWDMLWFPYDIYVEECPGTVEYERKFSLNPGEIYRIYALHVQLPHDHVDDDMIECKLMVFYDGGNPESSTFKVQ